LYQQWLTEAEQAARALDEAHLEALKDIAVQMDEIRKFAMRSIDDVRGETRAERDRRVHVEQLLKQAQRMTEVFRQMAYQRGGSIPPELRIETK
jgi:transcription termination factor Rho